jgi:hypothetical protein
VGSSHLLSVIRQRLMKVPPNELAKQTYAQARAAVAAGTAAWQNGSPAQAASVSRPFVHAGHGYRLTSGSLM